MLTTLTPRDPALDSTLSILSEGYNFIWNRCRRYDTDLFLTRLLGQQTVCIHGPEAARLFYDEKKFRRGNALPRHLVGSLLGRRAVHMLDADAHRHRKAAFLSLMSSARLEHLMEAIAAHWRRAIGRWERAESIVLLEEVRCVLTGAICDWAGVPLPAREVAGRARDFGAIVDAFGGLGPKLWRGKLARMRAERWLAQLVQDVRRGAVHPPTNSALHVLANHRELDGQPLSPATAAVELLNVLRPSVALASYVVFAALALHDHPEAREKLLREPPGEAAGKYADLFMQEVRRLYPFVPFLAARVRGPFMWRGHQFETGRLVLLDVYGTNHDPHLWKSPYEFRPERFEQWSGDGYDFIPQGGGSPAAGHRCPGEAMTMHSVTLALHLLNRCMTYEVAPNQDLAIDLRRMPARLESGLILRNVRATAAMAQPAPRLPSGAAARQASESPEPRPRAMQL